MKKRFSLVIVLLLFNFAIRSQIMLDGGFVVGTTFWGCAAETNTETVYGGSDLLNSVAEVDAVAGLCQTVIGLGIGNIYTLSYQCTRRTGGCPSPDSTNMDVTVSGGALSKTDTRSNTTFSWTTTSYNFTALSTSHTINFAAGSGFGVSTCGMIVDNISVVLFSPLPIELLYFHVNSPDDKSVIATWETASELNNNFFIVEKSKNSLDWEIVGTLKGAGTSTQHLKYSFTDNAPYSGISYYRLKQVDFDETYKYSSIQSIELGKKHVVSVYPNPSINHHLKISSEEEFLYAINVYNNLGEIVFSSPNHTSSDIDLPSVVPGIYYISISKNEDVVYRNRIVLQ